MAGNRRTVKASQLAFNVPYHVLLTGNRYENDGKFGTWWKWPIEVPSDNPDKQGQYATEFAYMSVGNADLEGKLEAAWQQFGRQMGDRVKADLVMTRVQVGDKGSDYQVVPANGQAMPPQTQPQQGPQYQPPQQPVAPQQPVQAAPVQSQQQNGAGVVRHAIAVTLLTYIVADTYAKIAGGEQLDHGAAESIAVHAGIYAEKKGIDLLASVKSYLSLEERDGADEIRQLLTDNGFEPEPVEGGADELPF